MELGDFLCGVAAGWAHILSSHPLDCIKTRIQIGDPQKSYIIAKDIYKEYGLKGFYRGASSLLFGYAFTVGIQFFTYEFLKKSIFSFCKKDNEKDVYDIERLSILEIALAGAGTGIIGSVIYCPIEYTKIQRQMHSLKEGSFSMLFKEIKSHGFINLKKGFSMTLTREIIGNFFYYSVYQKLVRTLTHDKRKQANSIQIMLAGSIAGLAYWVIAYPIDTIKTNMQVNKTMKESFKMVANNGFRGYGIILSKALISNAFRFLAYEKCQQKRKDFSSATFSFN